MPTFSSRPVIPVRWSREMGWLALTDTRTGEVHEIAVADAKRAGLSWAIDRARAEKAEWRARQRGHRP